MAISEMLTITDLRAVVLENGSVKLQYKYRYFNGHYDVYTKEWEDIPVVYEKDLKEANETHS